MRFQRKLKLPIVVCCEDSRQLDAPQSELDGWNLTVTCSSKGGVDWDEAIAKIPPAFRERCVKKARKGTISQL